MNLEQLRKSSFIRFLNKQTINLSGKLRLKEIFELIYWRIKKWEEKEFNNSHYAYFFTGHFGLTEDFYNEKRILDIGCGPRGSLEWAVGAKERIGLDPLADQYQKLHKNVHHMNYIKGNSEAIPFESNYFDVISAFNSLDHVDNEEESINEISRVLKPGGLFLLIVDIHEEATITEPTVISWDIVRKYERQLQLLEENHYEGHRMYKSIRTGIPFDHSNPKKRYGVLTAKFIKKKRP